MSDEKLRNLRHLLNSMRRRWTIMQMFEWAGLGLLAANLVLTPILVAFAWRGGSTATLFSIILICSLILGLFWGFLKRPSNVLTALLIDRQCNLAELFSSAWMLALIPSSGAPGEGQGGSPLPSPPPEYREREQEESLNGSLLTLADTRAKTIERSSIRLHRLDAPAWLMIAWMLALNLALIAMASNRAGTNAQLMTEASSHSRATTQSMDEPLVDLALSSPAHPVMPKDPDDPNSSHIGESSSQKPATENNQKNEEGANSKTNNARANGGGNGIATTHGPTTSQPRTQEQPEPSNRASTGNGKTAGGSGAANAIASPQPQAAYADANARVASPRVPQSPWQSPSWQADVSKAQLAVSHGQLPPAYRDLLTAYFR